MKTISVLVVAFTLVTGAWVVWFVVQPQAILGTCGPNARDPSDPTKCLIYQAHDCGVPNPEDSQWTVWMASCVADPHITTIPACWVGSAPDPSDNTRCIAPVGTGPP